MKLQKLSHLHLFCNFIISTFRKELSKKFSTKLKKNVSMETNLPNWKRQHQLIFKTLSKVSNYWRLHWNTIKCTEFFSFQFCNDLIVMRSKHFFSIVRLMQRKRKKKRTRIWRFCCKLILEVYFWIKLKTICQIFIQRAFLFYLLWSYENPSQWKSELVTEKTYLWFFWFASSFDGTVQRRCDCEKFVTFWFIKRFYCTDKIRTFSHDSLYLDYNYFLLIYRNFRRNYYSVSFVEYLKTVRNEAIFNTHFDIHLYSGEYFS